MKTSTLEARHVSRAFGPLKAVVDVSLTLEAGQIYVLLGRSGSGKSTLLRMFAGLERLDDGQILMGGDVIATATAAMPVEARGLGMVFQDYALFPHLTALDNVAYGLMALGRAGARAGAQVWLEKVGLSDRAQAYPHMLSGGEQQRVALARALAPQPKAVLMDEPFSGLDPHMRVELQATTLDALRAAGVGALVVSHDAGEALAIADNVAIMEEGRIIQIGTPQEVYSSPLTLSAARALGPVWAFAATAEAGLVQAPFGNFPTPLSGSVTLAARPEATGIIPDTNGAWQITDVRGVGRFVTLNLTHLGLASSIQAHIEADQAPLIGTQVAVEVSADNALIFAGVAAATTP